MWIRRRRIDPGLKFDECLQLYSRNGDVRDGWFEVVSSWVVDKGQQPATAKRQPSMNVNLDLG